MQICYLPVFRCEWTRAIAQFLELGLNVVADDVIWKREWLLDALRIFAPYRVYFVGVFVSDEEGARRERGETNDT
jgi:chloramphenicol 3-O phosphotransferase